MKYRYAEWILFHKSDVFIEKQQKNKNNVVSLQPYYAPVRRVYIFMTFYVMDI